MNSIASIASVSAATGGMAWAVRGRSSQVFGQSVWRGPRDRRSIALTFDDGPSEGTPLILEVLARHSVPATFFQCGANVERLPAIARAVRSAGHEIGNHSQTHPLLFSALPGSYHEDELRRAQETIQTHTGATPEWFRAPFGVRWFGLAGAQRRLQLTGVMWTIIGYDWSLAADAVVKQVCPSRFERRYPVSSRWTRASGQAGYRHDRGSCPTPGSDAAGPGL